MSQHREEGRESLGSLLGCLVDLQSEVRKMGLEGQEKESLPLGRTQMEVGAFTMSEDKVFRCFRVRGGGEEVVVGGGGGESGVSRFVGIGLVLVWGGGVGVGIGVGVGVAVVGSAAGSAFFSFLPFLAFTFFFSVFLVGKLCFSSAIGSSRDSST